MSKIFSIPGGEINSKNVMTEEQRRSLEIIERTESEKSDLAATELIIDSSNKVAFPGFPYKFEAMGEKIIVSIDIFKSGYECKVCRGLKRVEGHCKCEDTDRPGFRYSESDLLSIKEAGQPSTVVEARREMVCQDCKGDYPAYRLDDICPACRGVGATLILPETSKNLPTTGVIVSMGIGCSPEWRAAMDKPPLSFGIGDRILFGPYAGNMIPTKAGILFKIMDADHAWCRVEGANEMGQFDFVLQDEQAL